MAKPWVLDSDTKGTGAQVVPLKRAEVRADGTAPLMISPKRERAAKPPEAATPRRFRVSDAMTRRVLADDAGLAATVALLEGVARLMDVDIYVWEQKAERWKLLSRSEQQTLWDFRGRISPPAGSPSGSP